MNKSKILEFFDASQVKEDINIVGCGSIGSHVCEQLARMGFESIHIWDFDTVSAHNITNQMFYENQIGMKKTEAVTEMMKSINPLINIEQHTEGLQEPYIINGYIFLCVDSIELRKAIVEANMYNTNIKAIFDFRMRLVDAQYYAATKDYEFEEMLKTMDFTHEEAHNATPMSACGVELSVIYAPKTIVSLGIANFVKMTQGTDYKNLILVDMNTFELQSFKWKQRKKKESLGIISKLLR